MAYELTHEVVHHCPRDVTPAERMIMVVIAEAVFTEDFRRGVRHTSMPAEELARLSGLGKTGLKDALQRLAKREGTEGRTLELRVPLATGKDGRPLYAVPGKTTTYEVPRLPVPADCLCNQCKADIPALGLIHKGRPQPPLSRRKGRLHPPLGEATASAAEATASPSVTSEDTETVLVEASRNGRKGEATASPNQSREPGSSSPRARAGSRPRTSDVPTPTDDQIETIIEEIKDHGQVAKVDRGHAATVWREILGRASTPPKHPLQYVCEAIRREPHKHVPTPTPSQYQSARQLPLVAVASDATRAEVMAQLRSGTA